MRKLKRSGNPGYVNGKNVLAGFLTESYPTHENSLFVIGNSYKLSCSFKLTTYVDDIPN